MTTAPNPASHVLPGRTRRLRRPRVVAFLAFLLAGSGGAASSIFAQQGKPGEYQVKAVYLYNFAKFIDWPPGAEKDSPFTICILGRDPFGSLLDETLAGDTIGSRKPVARRVASVAETKCEILYISASEASRVKQILASIDKPGVLTVSDVPDFTANGGAIQFVLMDNKIRFEVNLAAAEKAGLTVSSQLLKVATTVRKGTSGPNSGPTTSP